MFHPLDLVASVAKRLRAWTFRPLVGVESRIAATLPHLPSLSKNVYMSVVKVRFNGLPTHFRMHKGKRCCLVCKAVGSEDRLLHYVQCPLTKSMLSTSLRAELPDSIWFSLGLASENEYTVTIAIKATHVFVTAYQSACNLPYASSLDLAPFMKDAVRRTLELPAAMFL